MSQFPKKGNIYWANLDPAIGSEIAKTRPVLIVSNDINNQYAATVSVLPVTSTTNRTYPFEVQVTSEESGLRNTSNIKANQIRTIDKRRIGNLIGSVSNSKMEEVKQAILIHLDIEFN